MMAIRGGSLDALVGVVFWLIVAAVSLVILQFTWLYRSYTLRRDIEALKNRVEILEGKP